MELANTPLDSWLVAGIRLVFTAFKDELDVLEDSKLLACGGRGDTLEWKSG